MSKTHIKEPPQKVQVRFSKNQDGFVFRLHPLSRKRVQESLQSDSLELRQMPGQIFISFDTRRQFDRLHGGIESQVASLLTGLSPKELDELGGLEFVDTAHG